MRICFVMEYHPADHMGGSEVQAFSVARELAALGNEVAYLCQRYDRTKPSEELIDGVRVLRKIRWRRRWRFLSAASVVRSLRRFAPDVIYQRFASPFTGACAYAAGRSRVPFVWGCAQDASLEPGFLRRSRGSATAGPLGMLKRMSLWVDHGIADVLFRYGVSHASVVVSQNRRQEELLREHFARESVVIPNGISVPVHLPVKPARPTVLWLNRMGAVKRPELFVRLARDVAAKRPDARFVMVGGRAEDEFLSEIRAQAETVAGLEVVGQVSREDTGSYFDDAWLFAITSEGEGFPNVLLQAWSHGAAAVSICVDPDDLLSREGLGVLSGSYERMVQDVLRLLEDRAEREGYAERAHAYTMQHFAMRQVAERYLQVFRSLTSDEPVRVVA